MEQRLVSLSVVLFLTNELLSFVNGEVSNPSGRRQMVCPPHNPPPVDYYLELAQCQGEVAASKWLQAVNANKTVEELVNEHGYDFESHIVISKDGYMLTIHRVPGCLMSPRRLGKEAVLLFHGLGFAGDSWLVLPSDKNLVFKLANAGYDVWVANGRGTDLSQGHVSLDSNKDLEYWDFSFHEMAVYDLPAIVELILDRTGKDKIFYIGYSMGGTLSLVGASEVPGLNDKIHASFLMAPPTYVGHSYIKSFSRILSFLYTPLEAVVDQVSGGRLDLRSPGDLFSFLGIRPPDTCGELALHCGLCDHPVYTVYDFNPRQANYTNLPNLAESLNVIGMKLFKHFGQNILSCQFRKYDYGTEVNLRRYGRTEPPSYNLGGVRTPLHIFYAEQDSQVPPPDIQKLLNDLDSDVIHGLHNVEDDSFDHTDFMMARDADILVYDKIINTMSILTSNPKFEKFI